MRIAIIGFGKVGKAFLTLINEKMGELQINGISLEIISIMNSTGGCFDYTGIELKELLEIVKNNKSISTHSSYSNEVDADYLIKHGNLDSVILITPTDKDKGEPGITYARKFLSNGINLIVGDKGPILLSYWELKELAMKSNCTLAIGCTTGGALPSINFGLIDISGSRLIEIKGILNGTSNYILEQMEKESVSFQMALEIAQTLGIAERNPSLDVEGYDTATKLLIIYNVLMNENKTLKDIKVSGITKLTLADIEESKTHGFKYKLVGKAEFKNGNFQLTVGVEKVYLNDPLYNVDGRNKAIQFKTDTLGDLTVIGGASDTLAAAASLLRDLINIHKGIDFTKF